MTKILHRKNPVILLISCIIAISAGNASAGNKLNITYDKQKLEAGKLQVFTYKYKLDKGGEGKRVVGIMLINASPEKVWKVLEDWEAMGNYVPSLEYYKKIHVIKNTTDNNPGQSYIEGKLKVAFLSFIYTLRVTFDRANQRQEWQLVSKDEVKKAGENGIKLSESSSSLQDIRGFEYIEPYGDGTKTIYYYAPIVEVSMPVPAWVERQISKSSLNEYMEGVKKKVEETK